jgi:hypothetical protein
MVQFQPLHAVISLESTPFLKFLNLFFQNQICQFQEASPQHTSLYCDLGFLCSSLLSISCFPIRSPRAESVSLTRLRVDTRRRVNNTTPSVMASPAFHSYRQTPVVICFFLATIIGAWSARAGEHPKPRQQSMCCSLAFFCFP